MLNNFLNILKKFHQEINLLPKIIFIIFHYLFIIKFLIILVSINLTSFLLINYTNP